MEKESKILVTGARGMVGYAVVGRLKIEGYSNICVRSSTDLDLRSQNDVDDFFDKEKFDYVIHLAATVGGIKANIDSPAKYLYDNLMINCNVINAACRTKVKKLLNFGSSCIYPRESPQPMKEEYILTGRCEPTNEGYAIGKIAAIKLCEFYNKQYGTNFISIMPPNLYGKHDHFHTDKSHVISALISKFHEAKIMNKKKVDIWGTGTAMREFLYVDDVADAVIYFMENYDAKDIGMFVNVGSGSDVSINELAELIRDVVGFKGDIVFDTSQPDGMPRKLMDSSKAEKMGWTAKTNLHQGLKVTYAWYVDSLNAKQVGTK